VKNLRGYPVAGSVAPTHDPRVRRTVLSGQSRTSPPRAASIACAVLCLALFVSAGAASALTPQGSAGSPHGPTLTISAGSVTTTGGKLKGSATVHNGGDPITRPVYLTLLVELSGADRLLKRTHVKGLGPGSSHTFGFAQALPSNLPIGHHQIWACASRSAALPTPSPHGGCRAVGSVTVPVPRLSPTPSPTPAPVPVETPTKIQGGPISTVPTAPITYEKEVPLLVADQDGDYYVDVPSSYDAANQTPTALLVWLHGCGGESSGDIYTVSPETVGPQERPRDWISIAVGGREGDCWEPNTDQRLVLNAIADVETHFNVDRHRVILGGYSSGGDLSYRLAFYDADQFAGVLAENTSPFRDTGSTEAASLAAAAWKFHVVHLAHLQDDVYPIAGVREETDAMIAAGFPLERIEVDGGHYDEPGAVENGHTVPGTDADLVNYLLPHIDDGWRSP
jgi:pimeloyl-ACP methyl ester carboxylesterase